MGRYAEAETVYRELLDAQRRLLGPKHPYTLLAMHGLATILRNEGKYAEPEKYIAKFWKSNVGCWDRNTQRRQRP
jgi:eukaryotic-like serine/threonine-protein kinase